MPSVVIQLNKGAFANVDDTELSNPENAILQKNILHTDSGAMIDRPGLSLLASVGGFPVIGMVRFMDFVVAVTSRRKVYSITEEYVVTDITGAADLDGDERPTFANDGTYLAIAGGGAPKRWSGTGDTELMPGSPVDSTHIVYSDGYWINFLLDDQELRLAGPTSTLRESWNTSDFVSAESLPDDLVALSVLQREVYAWGRESIETFQNFGDSTPFHPTFSIPDGTRSPFSIVQADNTHFYLNKEKRFMQVAGRTPSIISTPYDRVLQGLTTVDDCFGYRADVRGHYLIIWTFPTEERSFCFDYKTKDWGEWSGFDDGQETRFRGSSYAIVDSWNKHLIGDYRNGNIYELTFDAHSDGDYTRRCRRRSGYLDHGTSTRKKSQGYTLHIKRGVSGVSDAAAKLLVRFKDDDKGWSDWKEVSLGALGDFSPTVTLRYPTIYRKRQIEFLMTDSAELCLSKLEENVEILAS